MDKSPTKTIRSAAKNALKVPVITLRFDEPDLAEIFRKIETVGSKADRNPTAQLRFIARQWAEKVSAA